LLPALHIINIEKVEFSVKNILLVLFCVGFLVSCGGDERSAGEAEIEDLLVGMWLLECFDSNSGVYEYTDLEYSGDVAVYENEDCSGDIVGEDSFDIIYSTGEKITLNDGTEALEVDADIEIEGDVITILGLVHIENDRLYYGVETGDDSRPTEIDFSIYLTRM